MINTCIDEASTWLRSYLKQNNRRYKVDAQALLDTLASIHTIQDFEVALQKEAIPDQGFFLHQRMHEDAFISWRKNFIARINKMASDRWKVNNLLTYLDIMIPDNIVPLMTLLDKIITDDMYLLHTHMQKLLGFLHSETLFTYMLEYIAIQPHKARPAQPKPGSFDAVIPRNDAHANCLDLLRNVAATVKEKDPDSVNANNFLETLLRVFQDMHTEALTLEQREGHDDDACCLPSCSIM
jgi:hypothetical protein